MACIKPEDDIVTQPSAPSARQAVARAAQAPTVRAPDTALAKPALHVEPSAANQSLTSAHRAVRQATSATAVQQAVTDAANALHDARQGGTPARELRGLTSSYRSLQAEARSKIQSLESSGKSAFNDGSVYETRSPRYDGKTDHFFNESGSMRDPHGHVVEGLDSTPEHTTYDYVRDVDGNEYNVRP